MKILALGAHPDDIELFMYGLLSIFKSKGDDLYLGIATDGSAGGDKHKNLKEIRKKETLKALSNLGTPVFFDYEDGKLANQNLSMRKITDFIYTIKPDLIITHSPNDYHPDHRALSRFVVENVSFKHPVLFSENLMGFNFNPDYYFDITKYFQEKESAIKCHISQNPSRLFEFIKSMNLYRSLQCNNRSNTYVECYKSHKNFPFMDIHHLLPNTIMKNPFYLV